MHFVPVIGLEVHAQLKTQTKIFCSCSTQFGAPPNTHICPVCLGMPGVLPVLNKKVVDFTLRMALATHCALDRVSRFARKNYFYPDLPKGYQISQYELPIAQHGFVHIQADGTKKRIGITRIHMEEDAGKLIHDPHRPISKVDFNRTGVPLMEIVSEPDIRSPREAGAYLRQLRAIVRYLKVSDGNLEEGSIRCDANVSLIPEGAAEFGTRTEIKNLNSFRFVEKAINYEVERQIDLIEDGGEVVQETRLYDSDKDETRSMRSKEEANDYRYFPDPDLLPVEISAEYIESVRGQLPELPDAKQQRFVDDYDLKKDDAAILTVSRPVADYFEATVAATKAKPQLAANWVVGDLSGALNKDGLDIGESRISAEDLAGLLTRISDNTISGKIAKQVFEAMWGGEGTADQIIDAKGLRQITDSSAIEAVVDKVIEANPGQVAEYKAGKDKLIGFFVGQVMKETRGQANPGQVNQILKAKLSG